MACIFYDFHLLGMIGEADFRPQDLGGRVSLSFLSIWDFETGVTAVRKRALLGRMGSVSPMAILPLITLDKAQGLAALASNSDLSGPELGSLFHYLEIAETSRTTSLELKAILSWENAGFKTACLTGAGRRMWRSLLVQYFGPVDTWLRGDFEAFGDLLIALTADDWENAVEPREFAEAAGRIARESKFHLRYESRPEFAESTKFSRVCSEWLGDDEGRGFLEALSRFARNTLLVMQDGGRLIRQKRSVSTG